jgi:hypothetical protein
MKKISLLIILLSFLTMYVKAEPTESSAMDLPVRGLAIAAPDVNNLDLFLKFIEEELAPAHFNLLILRVDWNYAYESHPELRDPNPLTKEDVKKIVDVCKSNGIKVASTGESSGPSVMGKYH